MTKWTETFFSVHYKCSLGLFHVLKIPYFYMTCCIIACVVYVPGGLLWPAAAVAIAKAEAGDTEQREFSAAGTVGRKYT